MRDSRAKDTDFSIAATAGFFTDFLDVFFGNNIFAEEKICKIPSNYSNHYFDSQ